MSTDVDWDEVSRLLDTLYTSTGRLEAMFPGRKFTLDGHLVGSVGEVIAAYMFDLDLFAASNKAHDASAPDGRRVEIKMTQGTGVAIRHQPEHLIVLHRANGAKVRVVYNGPGAPVWQAAGAMASNGQRPISLSRLAALDATVPDTERLPLVREAPV